MTCTLTPTAAAPQPAAQGRWRRRQRDLATAYTHANPSADPIACFVTTFRLGKVWQHGEVLLIYRTEPDGPCKADLFDRVGTAVQSTLKAGFLQSAARPAERDAAAKRRPFLKPHNVRALQLAPDTRPRRGFMLGERRCFGHLDLRGRTAEECHAVISEAIQTRLHAQGFSYLKGAHCIGFANELLRALQTAFPEADTTARPISFCDGQCSYRSRPFLGEYLSEHGFGDVRESLERQQQADAPGPAAV